jgi:hypothetical protein
MTLVGTLTAVSATIGRYPVFAGQAIRYAIAAAALLPLAARQSGAERRSEPARMSLASAAPPATSLRVGAALAYATDACFRH